MATLEQLDEEMRKFQETRDQITERLQRTRAEGDLRENSGYEQAMNDLQVINIRINNIRAEIFNQRQEEKKKK